MAVSELHRRSGVPTEALASRKAGTDQALQSTTAAAGIPEGFRELKPGRVAPRGVGANGHATRSFLQAGINFSAAELMQ